MLRRARNWVRFAIERFMVRGAVHRLLFIAVAIVTIAGGAGILVWWTSPAFDSVTAAVWWAFLRLTDPGYLGDDQGLWVRTISTVVTVLGYVLFLGALIAIMTQWLNQTMARLQQGLTPIVARHHIVILGWTPRTPTIIRQLLLSEDRIRHFLRRHSTGRLKVALLGEELGPAELHELREQVGRPWNAGQVIVRSGSPLTLEHLHRVDFLHAAVAILPLADPPEELETSADPETVKTLRSVSHAAGQAGKPLPLVVAEVAEARNAPIAARAYGGPVEVVASDQLAGRILLQSLRHPGFLPICAELLSNEHGSEVYVRSFPELAGVSFADLEARFENAIPIGFVRRDEHGLHSHLNPPPDQPLATDDLLVAVAPTLDDLVATSSSLNRASTSAEPIGQRHERTSTAPRNLLVLGWNRRLPALIHELDRYPAGSFQVDLLTLLPQDRVQRMLERQNMTPEHVTLRQTVGDRTALSDLSRLDIARYNTIVVLAGDLLHSQKESDARSVTTCLMLRALLEETTEPPPVIVEILHEENAALLADGTEATLVSPVIISHILSQVGLRRELGVVFQELFGPGGGEIFLRPLDDESTDTFAQLRAQARSRGEIAIGLTIDGRPHLNPAAESVWPAVHERRLVVLATAP